MHIYIYITFRDLLFKVTLKTENIVIYVCVCLNFLFTLMKEP